MKNNSNLIIVAITLISVALIVGSVWFMSKTLTPNSMASNIVVSSEILMRQSSNRLGNPNAKIVIVEFSDFECPACAAAGPEVKKFMEQYKDQVLFVYRNYPLKIHPLSQISAKAAEAAGKQGKYWEMDEKLFANQEKWSKLAKADAAEEVFKEYAKELGLDLTKFTSDMNSPEIAELIKQDVADGDAAKLTATPTFYINGRQAIGFRSEQFNQIFREELAK